MQTRAVGGNASDSSTRHACVTQPHPRDACDLYDRPHSLRLQKASTTRETPARPAPDTPGGTKSQEGAGVSGGPRPPETACRDTPRHPKSQEGAGVTRVPDHPRHACRDQPHPRGACTFCSLPAPDTPAETQHHPRDALNYGTRHACRDQLHSRDACIARTRNAWRNAAPPETRCGPEDSCRRGQV